MNYLLIKQIHMALAFVSISGFIVRWVWQFTNHPLSRHRLTRIVPHVVDSFLVIFGFVLVWLSSLWPWQVPWLATKLAGLLAYILLGMAAMSRLPRQSQIVVFVLAVLTFAWMISVALTKQPMGFITFGGGN